MPTKPFQEYTQLLELLKQRHMQITDDDYALKNCLKLVIIAYQDFGISLKKQMKTIN